MKIDFSKNLFAVITALYLGLTSMMAYAVAPQAVKNTCSSLQGTHIYPQGNGAYLCLVYDSETNEYSVIGVVYENGATDNTVIHRNQHLNPKQIEAV